MIGTTRTLLTQDLLPCVLVYAVVVWLLVRYSGHRRAGPGPARRRASPAITIAGGYLVFAVLTAGISLAAGESATYIGKALLGGAILAYAIVAPLAAVAVAIARRRPTV